jgi:predicted secreted protein
MHKLIRFADIAACLFLLTIAPAFAADAVVASESDAGKTVSLHMGQSLTVNLTGTKDSGHYWRLGADLTPELVLSGRTASSLDVPGATETTSFTFASTAPGRVTFKASYLKAGAPIPNASDITFAIAVLP